MIFTYVKQNGVSDLHPEGRVLSCTIQAQYTNNHDLQAFATQRHKLSSNQEDFDFLPLNPNLLLIYYFLGRFSSPPKTLGEILVSSPLLNP